MTKSLNVKSSAVLVAITYFLFSIFTLVFDYVLGNLNISIVLIWLIVVVNLVLFNNKNEFIDPRCFFSAFFALYHTWYPISIALGRESLLFDIDIDILWEASNYSLFCLLVFVNVSNFFIMFFKYEPSNFKIINVAHRNFNSENMLLLITLSVVLFSFIFISSSDLKSKSDVNSQGGLVKLLSYYALLLSTALIILRMVRNDHKLYKDFYFILFLIVTIIYVGFTGERDVIFRFLICSLLVSSYKNNNFGTFKILSLVVVASIIVPVSQAFKAVFISGFSGVNMDINTVFSNEFISTSRNLYTLMYFGGDSEPMFIFSDIVRGLMPSVVTKNLGIISTSQWFNSHYRMINDFDGRAGWGFGLVPLGYLVGKEFGGFLVMSLSAMIINFIYSRSKRSDYWFVFYLLALTVLIYAMRADFANLVSQIFKITGVSMLIIYFSHRFLVRLNE